MYVQYKVNVSENQVDTLKDAILLKKGATLCFPGGGIRGDHVSLLTPAQINRLDKAQVEGRHVQIRKLYWRFYWYVGIARSSCYTSCCSCTTYNLVGSYNWSGAVGDGLSTQT